jgi:hypothetical protein
MIGHEVLDVTALTTGSLTLGGAVVGFVGGTASQVVHGRQDQATKVAERQERREEGRRQALIDFQEALTVYVLTVGRVHHSDVMAAKASGVWERQRRTPAAELDLLECSRRARQLSEWIIDDELRARFLALDRQMSNGLRRLPSENAAGNFVVKMSALLKATEERLGLLLRQLI